MADEIKAMDTTTPASPEVADPTSWADQEVAAGANTFGTTSPIDVAGTMFTVTRIDNNSMGESYLCSTYEKALAQATALRWKYYGGTTGYIAIDAYVADSGNRATRVATLSFDFNNLPSSLTGIPAGGDL